MKQAIILQQNQEIIKILEYYLSSKYSLFKANDQQVLLDELISNSFEKFMLFKSALKS